MEDSGGAMVDEAYEFSAPRFFDFVNGESEEDVLRAEEWFDTSLSYAPSPFMPKIKTERSVQVNSVCDFSETDLLKKSLESSDGTNGPSPSKTRPDAALPPSEVREGDTSDLARKAHSSHIDCVVLVPMGTSEVKEETGCAQEITSTSIQKASSVIGTAKDRDMTRTSESVVMEACTPKPPVISMKGDALQTGSRKQQTANKILKSVKNSSVKPRNESHISQLRSTKPISIKRDANVKKIGGTPSLNQENQAIKRQKLEGGGSRQILNIKPQILTHKTRGGQVESTSSLCPSTSRARKEDRKIYAREPAAPFVSMAEMMRRFESNTRETSLPHLNKSLSQDDAASVIRRKPKLTLTRPKEPEFETAQRVRPSRVKSSAELEEEMLAKIPKFKARPLNKKMMETPRIPPSVPRSIPQPPQFKEFHLETMARANQNAETSTVASIDSSKQNNQWRPHLTEPKTPLLQTSLRARPSNVKTTSELELEELEKAPKFKARPLNKKIFESKGDLGVFCNTKRNVTVPQEFHFAIDERIPPPVPVFDLFDKLSLCSEPRHDMQLPRITTPNPFNLYTEARGAEKEKKFALEVMQKQIEEERARVPKANPYPYTTDYPVIPPKPEPKHCTRPEPFQLESLTRHEEEMQRELEERQRLEKEEAERRVFRARPVLKDDPIPVQQKVRKPLTQIQEFELHVENRAVDRAEFDKKIKEKEQMYKRYREESESERMMEEEKALKQLRRTMVPHARPVPNFTNPFLPQKSIKGTTKAKSPNLLVQRRKERRGLTPLVAASSPAAQMR